MATLLLCSTPLTGHVTPMLSVGHALAARGHRVIMLTGSRFAVRVGDAGLEFVPLSGRADFDESDLATFLPQQESHRGLALSRYQVEQTFIEPLPDQVRALRGALQRLTVDGVIVDSLFAGVLPLLAEPRSRRPFVFALGVGPLAQLSRDVAPSNSGIAPSSTPWGRLRNRALNVLVYRVLFRQTQRLAQLRLDEVDGPRLDRFVLDLSRRFDRFMQLGPKEFEYPRSDLDPSVSFVGPVPTEPIAGQAALPSWWADFLGSLDRPVVHVTQGTLDNRDFGKLIRPTLDALAAEDVTVLVSTGGRPVSEIGALPPNAYAAEHLPYERILPHTDVMVSNGGYGGTLLALRHAVPLVLAGGSEDKPEVAARVAHFGVGVDLRSDRPAPEAIRRGVLRVLYDRGIHRETRRMAAAIARTDALASISDAVDSALGHR